MKKIWFLILGLFLTSGLFAQRFKAGLLAGLSASQVDGDGYAGYNKAGMLAGGYVSKRLAPASRWTTLFEITYIQKGSRKVPHPDKGDFGNYKLKLDYIEVPLLLKYDFSVPDSARGQKINFSALGGIAIGSLVNSAEWDASGLLSGGTPFQKNDFSYVLGLSYLLSEHIGFDVCTQYSLTPVRKGGTSSYYQNWTYKFFKPGYYNNLIVFSIRYCF